MVHSGTYGQDVPIAFVGHGGGMVHVEEAILCCVAFH